MAQNQVWRQEGFSEFIKGTLGNGGHNIYVSKAGVLQRIHQFDINGDGYVDLVFANSHDTIEKPPAYVYQDPFDNEKHIELASGGARDGIVADLNGDGYDDLVLGMWFDGITSDQNAIIYYGSPEGWSDRRIGLLPAPHTRSIAVGDFNGDGRLDLAFLSRAIVRIFYQTHVGFEPKHFTELEIGTAEATEKIDLVEGEHMIKVPADRPDRMCGSDIDGDGFAELIVRARNGEVKVYWGSKDGIDKDNFTVVPIPPDDTIPIETSPPKWASTSCPDPSIWTSFYEWATYNEDGEQPNGQVQTPGPQVINLKGKPHLFVARFNESFLVPVASDRSFGEPISFKCSQAMSVAVGDVSGRGNEDLVFACQEETDDGECSWIYWGSDKGYDEKQRTSLKSWRASDVAVADFDGDGCDDIVLSRSFDFESWSGDSLAYHGGEKVDAEPVHLPSHNALRALAARPSGDGKPVLALVNRMQGTWLGKELNAYVYWGGPDGFSPDRMREVPNWGASDAISCDVNDDGHPDLILANAWESLFEFSKVYVLLNGPEGLPDEPSLQLPVAASGVVCADVNKDGYLDIITCKFADSNVRVFYGNEDGFDMENPDVISIEYEGEKYTRTCWLLLADLNNDGWLDLVLTYNRWYSRSFILWGGPDGFSMDRCQVLSVLKAAGAQAADLTGNGYLDLIVPGDQTSPTGPHDSFLYIYWNGPEGLSEANRTILPANCACGVGVADFNNNGLLDILITNYWGKGNRDIPSYVYWNREGRGFSPLDRTELPTHSASGCIVADFNEDGYVDAAIAYHKIHGCHVGFSEVWWNGPDGFSEKNVTQLPTRGPHGMIWVDPGNIMDRGDQEYYTSCTHKLPDEAKVTGIDWEAELQVKTWVKAQIRFAENESEIVNAPWQGPKGEGTWFENGQAIGGAKQSGQCVQYRLALGAKNSGRTPRVTAVNVHYS